jgi:Excalibur calcium-binding domain
MRLIILTILVLAPLTGFAHSGRTDASGCHTDSTTGEYHCHGGGVLPKEAKTEARVAARTEARDYNCSDFVTHKDAQETYKRAGGPMIDPYDLDRDSDGIACESLT